MHLPHAVILRDLCQLIAENRLYLDDEQLVIVVWAFVFLRAQEAPRVLWHLHRDLCVPHTQPLSRKREGGPHAWPSGTIPFPEQPPPRDDRGGGISPLTWAYTAAGNQAAKTAVMRALRSMLIPCHLGIIMHPNVVSLDQVPFTVAQAICTTTP